MDLLFVCQFLFLTIALMIMGVLVAIALFASTERGRADLLKFYDKWRFRKDLKRSIDFSDYRPSLYGLVSPNEERMMMGYCAEDVKMVLALHKHIIKPHPTLYDEVAWDHGFYPHEDNDTETE